MAAIVVVESKALDELTTTQLADYAAMRALARIEPARIGAAADSEVPVTLTQWDFGFLKGLYFSPNNLYAPSQRSAIARAMEQEVDRSDGGAAPLTGLLKAACRSVALPACGPHRRPRLVEATNALYGKAQDDPRLCHDR